MEVEFFAVLEQAVSYRDVCRKLEQLLGQASIIPVSLPTDELPRYIFGMASIPACERAFRLRFAEQLHLFRARGDIVALNHGKSPIEGVNIVLPRARYDYSSMPTPVDRYRRYEFDPELFLPSSS